MSGQLSTFTFTPGLTLRAVLIGTEPWFVAKDVCDVLAYKDVSMSLARHVDDEDRQPFNLNSTTNRGAIRGNPRVSVINESGLYALILGSKKPEAKAFKKWVTSVVLPAVRKDGAPGHSLLYIQRPTCPAKAFHNARLACPPARHSGVVLHAPWFPQGASTTGDSGLRAKVL